MADFKTLLNSIRNFQWKNIKRYRWVFHVVLLSFFAKTISDIFVTYIDHAMTPLVRVQKVKRELPPLRPPNTNRILSFNIFNPTYRGQVQDGADSFATATPTQFKIKLDGTIVFDDLSKSIADILPQGEKESITVQKDSMILNNAAKILKIEYDRIYLLNTQTQGYEYLAMPVEEIGEPTLGVGAPAGPGIQTLGGHTQEIDRTMIRTALDKDNIAKTITDASSRFEVVGGRIVGVRITSVRPGSFYENLDIQRDDILEEVNGQKIDSLKAGTALFEQLRSNIDQISQPVTLTVIRNGQRITKTYVVK
ncbi:MAG: hypothetical protein HYW47_02130 [Deltaproteobacteria bacterium]|nr:hypothetical protein [Deltaproteobacteria bacterium]